MSIFAFCSSGSCRNNVDRLASTYRTTYRVLLNNVKHSKLFFSEIKNVCQCRQLPRKHWNLGASLQPSSLPLLLILDKHGRWVLLYRSRPRNLGSCGFHTFSTSSSPTAFLDTSTVSKLNGAMNASHFTQFRDRQQIVSTCKLVIASVQGKPSSKMTVFQDWENVVVFKITEHSIIQVYIASSIVSMIFRNTVKTLMMLFI